MLIIKNRGFKRRYMYGGSGIFDTIANLFSGIFTKTAATNAAKALASSALEAGKSAGKEVGKKALDAAGKKIVNKLLTPKKTLSPKSQSILQKHTQPSKTSTSNEPSLSSIIGAGGSDAIAIQDLVRKLNGFP